MNLFIVKDQITISPVFIQWNFGRDSCKMWWPLISDWVAHSLNALNGFGGISIYDGNENFEHLTPSHKDISFDFVCHSGTWDVLVLVRDWERFVKWRMVISPFSFYSVAKIWAFFVRNELFASFRSLFLWRGVYFPMAKWLFVKISGSLGLSDGSLIFRVSLSFRWLLKLMPRSEQWEYYFCTNIFVTIETSVMIFQSSPFWTHRLSISLLTCHTDCMSMFKTWFKES